MESASLSRPDDLLSLFKVIEEFDAFHTHLAARRKVCRVQEAIFTSVYESMRETRDELGYTVGLAVWGAAGPTFVRFEETNDALIISGRPGSVMPILTSSTGRVFGAYLPRSLTEPLLRRELSGVPHPGASPNQAVAKLTLDDVEKLFAGVREHGVARVQGDLNPGLHGLSVPIFDHAGTVAGVITLIGSAGMIDTRLDGPVAITLATRAAEVSRRMGWA